uniref:Protein FAR1-RELATED SEQUENCE n=1 Tax=Lactuca sativa TaxID=4236 RepID=A0A9R1XFM8_LACSA|nr:hypothetical protein LSAT_V11C500252200 [Lactuca sativa]
MMKKRHVENLPDHYILPRWTLGARYKVVNGNIGLEEMNCENGVSDLTLWCVRSNCDIASDFPTEIEKFNSFVINFLEDQKIWRKPKAFENVSQNPYKRISQVHMTSYLYLSVIILLQKIKNGIHKKQLDVKREEKENPLLLSNTRSLRHWLSKKKGNYNILLVDESVAEKQ